MKKELLAKTILVSVIVIGIVIRFWNITTPLADWHSFRQADTASVAREYVKHGIDLLRPRYHDLSNIQSGKENPEGYRMVEFPIINGLVAFVYSGIPFIDGIELHVFYRFINVLFSIVSALLLYAIFKRIESVGTGILTAGIFLFLPFNVYYSRSILPEIPMITFCLFALWFGQKYLEKQRFIWAVVVGLCGAIALLIKPVAAFLLLPLIEMGIKGSKGKNGWKGMRDGLMIGLIAVTPLVLWRWWIGQFPEGIPASTWLLNGNGIRFKGAFFYWIFAERIAKLILGYWGVLFLGLGILSRKRNSFVNWWVTGGLLYISIFASGNVQHDYYQIPLIPIISVLVAYGIQYIRFSPSSFLAKYGLMLVTGFFMVSFSWYYIRGYYNINNWAIVKAGEAVRHHTSPDALIIAPYMGDTAFLYQTERRGWPIGFSIDKRIAAGASYYVSTSYDDEARELEQKYTLVEKTADYILIKLK